jgi:hypothetical protein
MSCSYLERNNITTMETDKWLAEHEGHNVEEVVKDYLLDGGAIKRMKARRCHDCEATHHYGRETIEPKGGAA